MKSVSTGTGYLQTKQRWRHLFLCLRACVSFNNDNLKNEPVNLKIAETSSTLVIVRSRSVFGLEFF